MERYRPLRNVMPVVYGVVTVIPLLVGSVLLPSTLASDTYAIFFQSFGGGSLLVGVTNMIFLIGKSDHFRKKYQAIGDAMKGMEDGDTWRQTASTAMRTVLRWQRWFTTLVILSSALLMMSGVLFWIMIAGTLFGKVFFLASLVPLLAAIDALFAAIYYHSLLGFMIW